MVDDDRQLRPLPQEAQERFEVPRVHQRIEAQAQPQHRPHGFRMRRCGNPVVFGQVLQHRAHALELRMASPAFERRGGLRAAQVDPADHAADEVVARRQLEQELGLGLRVGGLHQHRLRDAVSPQIPLQMLG